MNRVTIFMPVSRRDHLPRVFASLELLDCQAENTNLLVVVDGDNNLFIEVRNMVEMSRFGQRLCLQFKSKHTLKQYGIQERRLRISDIHNFAKQHIQDCEYVFGLEDDTIIPPDTLRKLLRNYGIYPFAGFIEGIEMGRWGIPYIGAWTVDDVYNPQKIESTPLKKGIHEIDSGGFYCFITKRDFYVSHNFKPYGENGSNDLGPDVDYGITLRKMGLLNYADYSIKCAHKKGDGELNFNNTEPRIVTFVKKDARWRQSNKA